MAAYAPLLMASVLRLSKYGLEAVIVEQTDHTRSLREFFDDTKGCVQAANRGVRAFISRRSALARTRGHV
jgi:hypothetical protein